MDALTVFFFCSFPLFIGTHWICVFNYYLFLSSHTSGAVYLTEWESLQCELLHQISLSSFFYSGVKKGTSRVWLFSSKSRLPKMSRMGAASTDPEAWSLGWLAEVYGSGAGWDKSQPCRLVGQKSYSITFMLILDTCNIISAFFSSYITPLVLSLIVDTLVFSLGYLLIL